MPFTDTFIITIAQAETPQLSLEKALQEAGLKLAQVQDIYWADPAEKLPFSAVQINRGQASLQQSLHTAAQAIFAGGLQIVAAGGAVEGGFICFLLCSPAPVGRLNLSPLFRIAGLGIGPQAAQMAFDFSELAPSDLQLILKQQQGQNLPSLFDQLIKEELNLGLFEHQVDENVFLVTLVERA